nr:AAA-type ATPase family protein [Passiflora tenuiloba]
MDTLIWNRHHLTSSHLSKHRILQTSPSLPHRIFSKHRRKHGCLFFTTKLTVLAIAAASDLSPESSPAQEGPESTQLFEKLKKLRDAQRERMNKQEEFERRADVQMDRQLVMASDCKRRATEWNPYNSHRIRFSDFYKLLNSNQVNFIEYTNYGRALSVILPYDKGDGKDEVIFRRHVADRMPVHSWNDVWRKLHNQVVNVDFFNLNSVPVGIYSSVATAVVWSILLAFSVAVYLCIDSVTRPISSKLLLCDLRKPAEPMLLPPKRHALGSLGKSRAKFISAEETTGITFDDVAGQEYVKRELKEILRILKNDEEFQDRGIYCPKGVLLHGPPGNGKTLLAKAIAGESGLPFFATNGTDFVEMSVGVAASSIKDLFATARSYAPCIIFIDEIDAIGCRPGGPDVDWGAAEREHCLLQILTEMDGFKEFSSQVLLIGATNRLDILDPALLRKGRFDKIIRVGRPSKDGRYAILKVHARNKLFQSEAEKESLLLEIADLTTEFSGAELQNILNEAAVLTARKGLDYIGREELLEALKRQECSYETGLEDRIAIPEELKLRLAYREAAIAVLECYFPNPYCSFTKTDINSVNSRPNIQYARTVGKIFSRKSDYVNSIVRACAPRVIEEEIFGVKNLCWISSKATLEASKHAEFLILQTGMTAFGKAYYKNPGDLLPNLAPKLEALRDEYMRYSFEKCSSILQEYRSAVETITDILLEKGEIKSTQIWDIYKSAPRIPQPEVNPIDEYGALIYTGRWGIHGITLPGRVTFAPGNIGFSTFGARRPMETEVINLEGNRRHLGQTCRGNKILSFRKARR